MTTAQQEFIRRSGVVENRSEPANPLTTNFNRDCLLPGYPHYVSGSVSNSYSFTVENVYEIYESEFLAFVLNTPKKGSAQVFLVGNIPAWFQVDDVSIERIGNPMPESKFQVKKTFKLTLLKLNQTPVAPWDLPPYNYRETVDLTEENVTRFWPHYTDPLYTGFVPDGCAFTNTAGINLEMNGSRSLTRFEFSYNIRESSYKPDLATSFVNTCNANLVRICGIYFPPMMVRINSISTELTKSKVEYTDYSGTEVQIEYTYYKVDVSLIADPKTYNKNYLNVGVHIRKNRGVQRLWSWKSADNSYCSYGTYQDYITSGGTGGEEVSENLFLNNSGDGISTFSNGGSGNQIPTYRIGSIYPPVEFWPLCLPAEAAQPQEELS